MSSIFFHLLNFGVCCRSPVPHACCFCFCLGLGQGFSSPPMKGGEAATSAMANPCPRAPGRHPALSNTSNLMLMGILYGSILGA